MNKVFGIRALVALLCLVLMLAAFAACDKGSDGGDGTTAGGDGTTGGGGPAETGVSVAELTLVLPADDEDAAEVSALLLSAFREHTGIEPTVSSDSELYEDGSYEILLGATNRTQSAEALERLNGQSGFVVLREGNRVVINATYASMLDDAVNYFVNNCLADAADGVLDIPADLCFTYGSTGGFSLLAEDGTVAYGIIYDTDLDTKKSSSDANNGLDYVVPFMDRLESSLEEALDVKIVCEIDEEEARDENLEILFGRTNRPETLAFLRTCKVNEYGYAVVGNKLVISGWSELTIGKAADLFIADLEKNVTEENGVRNLVFQDGFEKTATYDVWDIGVPLFRGGSLSGVVELINQSYEAYYEGATAEQFLAYRRELEGAGYLLWQENQIGENLYATYYTGTKRTDTMIHTYYISSTGTVRVIVESMKTAILPQKEDNSPLRGEKITDVTFTMFDSDEDTGNWGNCFIITLEDGSFILHDGGSNKNSPTPKSQEARELYNLLNTLNKRPDGEIVIAAWFISHQHSDHFATAYAMFTEYYTENITIERIVYNVPSPTMLYNSGNPNTYYENGNFDEVCAYMGGKGVDTEQVVVHTGQTIQIRNLTLEILYTIDDIYPYPIDVFNNSSIVHRFRIGEGENEQTMLICGDLQTVGSQRVVEMYGDELKCDFAQVAHHGKGGSVELYDKCRPTVVFWPNGQKSVNTSLNKKKNLTKWDTINQTLCNQENVKLLVVADDGHKVIPLPLLGITDDEDANADLIIVIPRADGAA